ncbi:barwin-like endoglucanase [Ceraceosorus guamensis]|uniref:Barwin-like endoglucanase n=1 Tax=Ceraceosorus guamensis TaxID=1522189 RepID=A0A316VW98_9BASI|nr:barwin-like endoglucanase [Ceraceosorus guamensis]PWN41927.1 barwin-like endoglucanase [Ceraceosorus guamensis]
MRFSTVAILALSTVALASAAPVKRANSGHATFFYQGGNAGSCGTAHSDSDAVVAISSAKHDSSNCGKWITITNTQTGQTTSAQIADTCPTCGTDDIDLSKGAFNKIGTTEEGEVPVTWHMN